LLRNINHFTRIFESFIIINPIEISVMFTFCIGENHSILIICNINNFRTILIISHKTFHKKLCTSKYCKINYFKLKNLIDPIRSFILSVGTSLIFLSREYPSKVTKFQCFYNFQQTLQGKSIYKIYTKFNF